MKPHVSFFLLLGFLFLSLGCSEKDLDSPKESCPDLIGEWRVPHLFAIQLTRDIEIFTGLEQSDEAVLLNNIEGVLNRIDSNYELLLSSSFSYDFRSNGEVIADGVIQYFRCSDENTIRISESKDFDQGVGVYRVIYKDEGIMITNSGTLNKLWMKL